MTSTDKKIQVDYSNRINKVFDFIHENLESELTLNVIADIAFFSPYHFHRIFKYITGETLNQYVNRQRIEKSALDLLHKHDTTTEIAHKYGFNDLSSFSRSFKKYYGVNPTQFKKQNSNKHSKISQLKSKNGQVRPEYEVYICNINNLKNWIKMNAKIEVRETPERSLAAVTHIGVNGLEEAFGKLIRWATPIGLLRHSEAKMGRLFYDSFKVTAPDKVRMSVFIISDESFETDGEITKLKIKRGKCIVGRFIITPDEFEKSWTSLFVWMNENGYKTRVENPFEIYHNDYREHPENKCIVDLHIPIE